MHPLISSTFALLTAAGALLAQQAKNEAAAKPHQLLRSDGKPAAHLVARPWDPEHPRATCKVYHHLYAPDGRLLTKGEGGQFEHHRGLFVGWNQTKWNGQQADFWHMTKGARQVLDATPPGGPLQIVWRTDDEVVVVERRQLELVDESESHHTLRLSVALVPRSQDEVVLDGDPQHAGQQLRALQQFAEEHAEPVRYLRPEGSKEHGNDVWTGCDWTAAVLPLEGGPVTVLRIEGVDNPGPATWSTRPYGRFGATRRLKLHKAKPTRLEFFYVIALGEQNTAWCQAQARRWRTPPKPKKK